ncbi:MAG TPA: hypothetical protein VGB57_09585 [Allosphingosinicella sp.]|jgi:hypothetical protein
MSTHSAPPGGRRRPAAPAAAPAEIRSGQGRRPTIYEGLRALGSRFDQLQWMASQDSRSQRDHDNIVDEAEAIAGDLRALVRGRSGPEAVNPPLWDNGRGRAAW